MGDEGMDFHVNVDHVEFLAKDNCKRVFVGTVSD